MKKKFVIQLIVDDGYDGRFVELPIYARDMDEAMSMADERIIPTNAELYDVVEAA
jgi:hypothetical protein